MSIKIKLDLEKIRQELERRAELNKQREVGDRLEKKPKPERIQ